MPAAWIGAGVGALGLLGAGNSSPSGQTTSTNAPWDPQQQYLRDIFSRAQSQYNLGPQQYYPGSTVADQSANTQQALGMMAGTSTNPNSLTNQSLAQWGKTVNGDYLSADSNPYLKGTVDKALNDVQGRINTQFGTYGGNNFGSSGNQEWMAKNLADTALPIYAQNYQQERARQVNAAQLGPGMDAQGYAGIGQAGAAQDAYAQKQTDASKARFDFQQTSPWDNLQKYQSAISGNYGSQQSNPYFTGNPLLSGLGAASAGLGIYGQGKQAGLWGQPQSMAGNTNYDSQGNFTPTYSGYDASNGFGSAYG